MIIGTHNIHLKNSHEEIFAPLHGMGYQKIASRLRYLHKVTQNENPEDPAMEFMSLRELALFLMTDHVSLIQKLESTLKDFCKLSSIQIKDLL